MQVDKNEAAELSGEYFSQCAQLQVIAEPFQLKNVPGELERRDFEAEFELIRALTETKRHKLKLRVNSIIENKKNRYPQQSIYQHSRVQLPQGQTSDSTYINANHIPLFPTDSQKKLIMTQAPLQSTQTDFESMLRQEKIQCVIMLCNIVESGKVRCFDYLENREVEVLRKIGEYMEVSTVKVENNEQKWDYTHIHYTQWPDRGLPAQIEHLRQVVKEAIKYDRIAIHCSAGLGRSGVLGAALILQLAARSGEKVSVFDTVRRMRQYRFGAVQNNEQYKYIYSYLAELNQQLSQ